MRVTSVLARLLAVAGLVAAVAAPASAQLRAELVADGFERPLAIVPHPDRADTLIVAQQDGLFVAVVDGVKQETPFLDLRSLVTVGSEEGVLGLAFAPFNHEVVFVSFSNKRDPSLPFPTFKFGDTVVSRFHLKAGNPLEVDPASRFDLVWPPPFPGFPRLPFFYQVTAIHKGGNMQFGPDGYLYIGFGDGGGADSADFGAQHPDQLFGKMIRIDVDVPDTQPNGYVVPADNPFVDKQPIAALPEIWAFGYRNPWRWSFDDVGPGATNAMIVGDVGESHREEIDYEPAGRGGRNYGWFIREGLIATTDMAPAAPAYGPLTDPIVDYPRSVGQSIIGGYVYRGPALGPLYQGRYFVGDFFGHIFSVGLSVDGNGEGHVVDAQEHTGELLSQGDYITTFGRDLDGELYFASSPSKTEGAIYKIVPASVAVPAAPVGFAGRVTGSSVSLSWQPAAGGGPAVGYVLEAGSAPGAANLITFQTRTPSLTVPSVPNGLYYVRVRAINSAGTSDASTEIPVRIGCGGPAFAPSGLAATVGAGGFVSVTWTGTAEATSYLLDIGATAGGSELGSIPLTGTSLAGVVPAGTYYARIRAVTPCGVSGPSNEVLVTVN